MSYKTETLLKRIIYTFILLSATWFAYTANSMEFAAIFLSAWIVLLKNDIQYERNLDQIQKYLDNNDYIE